MNQVNQITQQHLREFKLKRAEAIKAVSLDGYAQGFIKACTEKQVEPEKVMEVIELLDIHL